MMKLLSLVLLSASSLISLSASAQQPIFGLSLQPVRSVTSDSAGRVTVLGNMPQPANIPPERRQTNQAIFPASADRFGCANLARQAAADGRTFTVMGVLARLGAVNGTFTMEFASLDSCWLN